MLIAEFKRYVDDRIGATIGPRHTKQDADKITEAYNKRYIQEIKLIEEPPTPEGNYVFCGALVVPSESGLEVGVSSYVKNAHVHAGSSTANPTVPTLTQTYKT